MNFCFVGRCFFMNQNQEEKLSPMQRWGGEILALVVLVPLVIVIGAVLIKWPALSEQATEKVEPAETLAPIVTQQVLQDAQDKEVGQVEGEEQLAVDELQTVSLNISGIRSAGSFEVQVVAGESVSEIMARAQDEGVLTYKAIDYGGSMGLFFEQINGVKNNQVKDYFWHLYVNGEKSSVGASSVGVEAGDEVEWKYEEQEL